jgi:peptidoglycan/LPS O-acetylase OafA/YrhL
MPELNNTLLEKDSTSRQFGLDLMRACSIIMVFFSHSIDLNPLKQQFPYFAWMGFGVEAFFTLSGFLIGRIILNTLFSPAISWSTIGFFWTNRWLRTLPAYFVALLIYFIFTPHFGLKALTYLFFCQNIITPVPYFFPHSWSLAVEEWFYLSFPLVLFAIHKIVPTLNKARVFWAGTLIFILFGLCSKFILYYSYQTPLLADLIQKGWVFPSWKIFLNHAGDWDTMRKIVPFRIDAIAYGCIIALLFSLKQSISIKQAKYLFGLGGICLGLSYFIFATEVINIHSNYLTDIFLLPLFSVSFALMIPLASLIPPPQNKTLLKVVTNISLTSYSFYLIHFLIIELFLYIQKKYLYISGIQFALLIGCYISIYAVSFVMYNYIEIPFLKYRSQLRKTRQNNVT